MQQKIRQVIAYKNYFLNFYNGLSDHVQIKIEWTLKLIEVTQRVPEKYNSAFGLCLWKGLKDSMKFVLKLGVIFTVFSHFSTKEI